MVQIRTKRWITVALMGLLLTTAACQPLAVEPTRQAETAAALEPAPAATTAAFVPSLINIGDMAELRAVFNAHADMPRLILLLSPT